MDQHTRRAVDIILNMMFIFTVKTITMVEMRTDSERIVKELSRGVRMTLSYRGKPIAELVPMSAPATLSPLEALDLAQQVSEAGNQAYAKSASAYLKQLRKEQKAWSDRR